MARLYTNGSLERAMDAQFTGDYAVHYHFAPEYLGARRGAGRTPLKRRFGPAARYGLQLLARLRGLRGTPLDPFGWSAIRRDERALAAHYARTIGQLLPDLSATNLSSALQIAALPDRVRGFGRLRQQAAQTMIDEGARLLQRRSEAAGTD